MKRPFYFMAVAAMLLLGACKSETYTWFEKTIVHVRTPEGTRTGATTVKVILEYFPDGKFATSTAYETDAEGEAAAIDLGARGILVVHIPTGQMRRSYLSLQTDLPKGRPRLASLSGNTFPPTVLAHASYPAMSAFSADPRDLTVHKINPDDLAGFFGEDVSLESIQVAITDGPAVQGQLFEILPRLLSERALGCSPEPCTAHSPGSRWPDFFQRMK